MTLVPAKKQIGIVGGAVGALPIIVKVFPYKGIGVLGVKPNLFLVDTYIVINPEFVNAFKPISVTEAGMVIDVNLVQPLNAFPPIVSSCEPDANVIDVKPVQLMNAERPIVVTEAGMIIDVKLAAFRNALAPMLL